jgi:outer membrane protein assembly factor BamB
MTEFEGQSPGWGVCESVLVDENRVICTPGGNKATFVALNPANGDVIWKVLLPQKDHAGYASPTVAEIGGLRQYVHFTSSGTVGVRADDGSFLWRDDSAANGTANCSSPLVDGKFVFSSSNYGTGGSLVKLAGNSAGVKAELVYHTHHMSVHHGDMVIVDGLVFGASDPGVLTCLDLPTGNVKWASRAAGKGSITAADGRLYLRTETGTLILVEATGSGYRELGRFEQPNRSKSSAWAHPVVAGGRLFLRDQDLLLCYDLKTPPSP